MWVCAGVTRIRQKSVNVSMDELLHSLAHKYQQCTVSVTCDVTCQCQHYMQSKMLSFNHGAHPTAPKASRRTICFDVAAVVACVLRDPGLSWERAG